MREPGEGDRFGPYTIRERLGSGAMGHVFRALGNDGTEVALKILRPELGADQEFRKRFEREAKVAAKVRHPHVVPTIERGEIEGVLYLAQAFIGGGSLDVRLKREGRLSLEDTVRLCDEVASGLDALHAAGLVHRDVKPPNIMLETDGRAYIADLGLAKDREASVVLTKIGQAVGSIEYMAPEQIRAQRDPDARTDVYGLGCVVYECISGAPPFADREPLQMMWAHLQDDPADPCEGRGEIPDGFGLTITRALEKDPGRRPPTATAFARMLRVASGLARTGDASPA
jgi:serine/threonine protein kinase